MAIDWRLKLLRYQVSTSWGIEYKYSLNQNFSRHLCVCVEINKLILKVLYGNNQDNREEKLIWGIYTLICQNKLWEYSEKVTVPFAQGGTNWEMKHNGKYRNRPKYIAIWKMTLKCSVKKMAFPISGTSWTHWISILKKKKKPHSKSILGGFYT